MSILDSFPGNLIITEWFYRQTLKLQITWDSQERNLLDPIQQLDSRIKETVGLSLRENRCVSPTFHSFLPLQISPKIGENNCAL